MSEALTVACVVDVSQRAHDASGEPTGLSWRYEVLDGVPHVRLVTDPVSVLLPLSAWDIAVADLRVEAVARAIYAVELARDANANSLLVRIRGEGKHDAEYRIEAYEENPESWRDYARAALAKALPPQEDAQ